MSVSIIFFFFFLILMLAIHELSLSVSGKVMQRIILIIYMFFLNEWYNAGNRIGCKTHYWRLFHDLARSIKGSIAISFLEDPADNTRCVY